MQKCDWATRIDRRRAKAEFLMPAVDHRNSVRGAALAQSGWRARACARDGGTDECGSTGPMQSFARFAAQHDGSSIKIFSMLMA
jgi:hypothetical protein